MASIGLNIAGEHFEASANITFFATSGGGGIESAVTDLKWDYPELQILGSKLIHGIPEEDVLATL